MKKKLTKKLALGKETIASLNNAEQATVMAGNMDASMETVCQTNCRDCNGDTGGGSGNNPSYTCGWACPDFSHFGDLSCTCFC